MLSRSQLLLLLWVETGALVWTQGHHRHVPPPVVPAPPPAAMPCTACPVALPTPTQKPHPAPAPLPLRACKLAFVRGNDVWTANRDGTNARLLLHNANSPRWSWDHKQLAFARDNIWMARADGTGERPLTTQWKPEPDHDGCTGYGIEGLTWDTLTDTVLFSHDETLTLKRADSAIAPREDVQDGRTIDADSLFAVSAQPGANRAPVALLDVTEQGTSFSFSHQEQPAFSRSGKYLAFARNGDIWLAQRGERRNTYAYAHLEDWGTWQWDVSRLKATADYDDPNYHGSRQNVGVTGLAWSPDEKHLAYALHRLQGSGYAVVNVLTIKNEDGYISAGATRQICDNGTDPCFTPDGKWIAYSQIGYANEDNSPGIWFTSLNGKTTRKLISNAEQPAW